MNKIRRASKFLASFIAINLLAEIAFPTAALALTSGPSQPEVQSFEPFSTSRMVDAFSGDFTYNIPLLDIEGYPINISYNSGVSMDQEASWVGLGWNISPGVINRNMRGIPDDFNGDQYERELNIKDNITVGLNGKIGGELFGFEAFKKQGTLSLGLGIKYNNYRGVGFEPSANISLTAAKGSKGEMTAGLGISSSDDGLSISPSASFSTQIKGLEKLDHKLGGNVGVSFNRRSGLQQMSFGMSATTRASRFLPRLGSSSISFGVPTYTPSLGNQYVNATYTLSMKFGGTLAGQDYTGDIAGYYSSQRLANPTDRVPAYGYMNLQNATDQKKVNLDFNRENDGEFSLNTPTLPLTNLTYDVYSVAGQGVSGSYRMFRNDMGYVFDPYQANTSLSGSLGLEASAGGILKNGFDLSVTDVNTYTEKWDRNSAAARLRFRKDAGYELFEPAFFKEAGEKNVDSDPEFYTKMGGDRPVRFKLSTAGDEYGAEAVFVDDAGNEKAVPTSNYRNARQKRNQTITYLTRGEMKRYGLDDHLANTYNAPDHHIGQITTLRNDGARYIFGIACYNSAQEETSFSVGSIKGDYKYPTADGSTGLIRYRSKDNSLENDRGLDHYYSNTKTPPFAHSYLLTAVLSNEYIDVDNERGPSPGDVGNYTKFSYTKVDRPYKWRTPFTQYQANYNEGKKSDPLDDQANYLYGEKELWYLEKIESKNYIAIFTLEDRDDGYGVRDKNGGRGDVSMKLLRKISLYARVDYENSANPVPIKEVHFEYDYSLCKGIPNQVNSGQGKLTLKKVYFTYRNSYRAKYNAYNFSYNSQNPNYNGKSQDRWGNYKPNTALTYQASEVNLSPAEFPYTVQDPALQNLYAQSWNLEEIQLPTGGKIKVTYESDDYAYVQDKRAMEMFIINNVGENDMDVQVSPANKQELQTLNTQDYIFFKLKEPLPGSTNLAAYKPTLQRKYLQGINDLYFRFLVNITNENGVDQAQYNNSFEYVSGYCEIDDYGVSPVQVSSEYRYGYVKVKKVKISDNNLLNTHPIRKAAWNYGKMNLPRHVYRQQDPTASGIEQMILAISNKQLIRNVIEFALGANGLFFTSGYGKQFYRHKSWIRLNSPGQKKLGGGCRVSKVEMSDEWGSMAAGNSSFSYGQTFKYTKTDEYGEEISSGVASYEPGIGSDENPFKTPIYHGNKEQKVLAPDDIFYTENPIGESFFPSPGVGYSKVTVQNLKHDDVTRNANGKVVHEYYTAKDFPTITRRTGLEAKPYKTSPVAKLFSFKTKDFMTTSQGFVVELNDMHGKEKKQMVYAEGQSDPISGVETVYKSKPLSNGTYQLDNEITVIRPDGTYGTATAGLDYDFVADMRSQTTKVASAAGQFNIATIPAIGIPFPVPTAFPDIAQEETRYKSATTTKVIKRHAIQVEKIAYENGARNSSKFLAFDSETGEPLLTQTFNSFNDPVYSLVFPAHWVYDNMRSAYLNTHLSMKNIVFIAGQATITNAGSFFFKGDELIGSDNSTYWVVSVEDDQIQVMNRAGGKPTATLDVKVLRSGARNMQSNSIGRIVSLSNPLDAIRDKKYTNVISALATEFSDDWPTYCNCFNSDNYVSENPYVTGQSGIWRQKQGFLYLTNRSQSRMNANTNIRVDGVFESFSPFWTLEDGKWVADYNGWQSTGIITMYDPQGNELENQNAKGEFSTGIYGYNHGQYIATATNMKYTEFLVENFEDFQYQVCNADKSGFKTFNSMVTSDDSHSGEKSVRVQSGAPVSINKSITSCP